MTVVDNASAETVNISFDFKDAKWQKTQYPWIQVTFVESMFKINGLKKVKRYELFKLISNSVQKWKKFTFTF